MRQLTDADLTPELAAWLIAPAGGHDDYALTEFSADLDDLDEEWIGGRVSAKRDGAHMIVTIELDRTRGDQHPIIRRFAVTVTALPE